MGYSVSQYLLDGQPISELLGQVSPDIGVELIATFLPRVVVNGLFAVLQRAGLEPASLTLEPIAALEVSVPRGMRQLNLALLDIGAGTADIALVRHGRVFAYDMAPLAGDKITDSLCQQYLLDFATGEAVKKQLTSQDEVTFTCLLYTSYSVKAVALGPAKILIHRGLLLSGKFFQFILPVVVAFFHLFQDLSICGRKKAASRLLVSII